MHGCGLGEPKPDPPRAVSYPWVVAGWLGAGYGIFLTVVALHSPPGADLTGQYAAQPLFKASMAVLLAAAAVSHPRVAERRWLIGALLCSALGDWLLAIPWWTPAFVAGLGAFLLAHLCYLGALIPLAGRSVPRLIGTGVTGAACLALLVWFWPGLVGEGMVAPVIAYIGVLGAMVSAALLARLPTVFTAVGAVCFAVSDAMIGIGRFAPSTGWSRQLGGEVLAVPIWWAYAAAQILITAGFFFGRGVGGSDAAGT